MSSLKRSLISFYVIFFTIHHSYAKSIEVNCASNRDYFNPHATCVGNDITIKDKTTKIIFNYDKTKNLTAVKFHSSQMQVLPMEVFDQFPYLRALVLELQGIDEIRKNSFEKATHLENLDLELNRLTEIGDGTFDGAWKLRHLDLSMNKIKKVTSKAFRGLVNLEHLGLSGNEITELEEGTFSELRNLKSIYLYSNYIKTLYPRMFIHCQKLEVLDINTNELEDVELYLGTVGMSHLNFNDNFLRKLTIRRSPEVYELIRIKITFLYLGNNLFGSLSDISIDPNIFPVILRLNDNNITLLMDNHSYAKMYLKELHIERNPIQFYGFNFFSQFEELELLNLTETNIQLTPKMFKGLKRDLRELSLRHNSMTTFEVEWVRDLSFLKRLDLEGNLLEDLDYNSLLLELPYLEQLKLSGNRFNCSFVQKMVRSLSRSPLGRLRILDDPYQELSKEKINGKVYGITCDVHEQETKGESEVKNSAGGSWSYILSDFKGLTVVILWIIILFSNYLD